MFPPWPLSTPILCVPAIRTPILKVGSLIKSTIDDVELTDLTTPTNPPSDITVMFLLIPELLPTSIVIVSLNVAAEPLLITFAATTL